MVRPIDVLSPLVALTVLAASAAAQTTERASVATGGGQGSAGSGDYGHCASDDGRYVAFYSAASDLVAGDVNGVQDIFLRDRQLGTTVLVSLTMGGAQSNGFSEAPSISADGQVVAFTSSATNLSGTDTNGLADVFVRYVNAGITIRYSTSSFGGEGNAGGAGGRISADGVWVVFQSTSTNLVAVDVNAKQDIFIHRNQLTELVSVSTAGVQANDHCWSPVVSADGRYVVFYSAATNLVASDFNGFNDVFLRDRQLGTTELISKSSSGTQGNDHSMAGYAVSDDGRFVVFGSPATFLVPGDANGSQDVFLRDRLLGTTEIASVSSGGVQGNGGSLFPWISGNGRFIAYHSLSANLVPNKTNFGANDVYVRDRIAGITERVSLSTAGLEGNGNSIVPWISGDGRFVSFCSYASSLVAGDTNGFPDAFLHDRGAAAGSPSICAGDGVAASCPCGNNGITGHGCQNSVGTNGATLSAHGNASLAADTLKLTTSGQRATALSLVVQGSAQVGPLNYGDGLRCAGGTLKRLYSKNAVGGIITVPVGVEPSISSRSAALGDTLSQGAVRVYQVYYRDPDPIFCSGPTGGTFNVSSGARVTWNP